MMRHKDQKPSSKPDLTETLIRIKLTPRASKNEFMGKEGDLYRVKVTSPPVEGMANEALIKLLAKKLRVPKGHIEIISGKRSRLKSVRVRGISGDDLAMLLGE